MKKSITIALFVLLAPSISFAAPRTFSELADLIVSILNTGTGLLVLAGIVVYFWGISTNLLKMKDEGGKAFKAYFIWGIIAIFVMVSIWGILEILQNTLFGGDSVAPNGQIGSQSGNQVFGDPEFPVFGE